VRFSRRCLAAKDGGVSTALGGVLRSKTPRLKIIMDAAKDGGVSTALGGVLRSKTPRLKIIMDDDFKPARLRNNKSHSKIQCLK